MDTSTTASEISNAAPTLLNPRIFPRLSEPFCDFLSLSFPAVGGVQPPIIEKVILFLGEVGCSLRSPDLWDVGGYGGTVKSYKKKGVHVLSLTGAVMRDIREGGLLRELCMLINEVEHRVTRLDASCDFIEDAPHYIAQLYRRVRRGSVVLGGKKVVRAADVQAHFQINEFGERTGGLYLGKATSEVRVLVYDKRFERVSKGFPDPGKMLRVEVRLRSQVGCSVFDAVEPERLFYHYAAPDLCEPPAPVRSWEPHGTGFSVEPLQANYTTYQRLKWLVEESATIKQALRLIAKPDSGGLPAFMNLLDHKLSGVL
jgi:hypothetical protein